MADEKAVVNTEKAKTTKKKAKRDTFKWFRELKAEFKKIVWPTGKQLKNNTIVVFAMVIAMSAAIALVDWGFKTVLSLAVTGTDGDYEYTQPDEDTESDEGENTENNDEADAAE